MRTVTNTRVIDNETGNTIAWVDTDDNGAAILTRPDGRYIATAFPDTAPVILLTLQIASV